MEERRCLECGEPLRGRADQKYCNDLCRNAYNNKKLSGSSNFIRKINRILKKNHAILEELNPEDKTTTLKSILEKKGFNFEYFTNTYTTQAGRVYYFCYDQGYSELEKNKYMLVKKEE
jgi:F0F1-type ATP synthase delta subunit